MENVSYSESGVAEGEAVVPTADSVHLTVGMFQLHEEPDGYPVRAIGSKVNGNGRRYW